jgi:nicotinate-nucleotide adenylyltransferase
VVLYVPAARNPLKEEGPEASDAHRLAMLALAVREVPGAEVCAIEIERGGASFFVETLAALRVRYGPDATLRFLLGADQALDFHRWKAWETILELAAPVVVLRPPWDESAFDAALRVRYDDAETAAWRERVLPAPLMDIDGTSLRDRMHEGQEPGHGVAPAVAAYIARHGLYGGS